MSEVVEEFDLDTPTDDALLFGDSEVIEEVIDPEIKEEGQEEIKEEAEANKEAKADEEKEGKSRSAQIPRERFDAVNLKFKAEQAAREQLEVRLAELEKKPGHVVQSVDIMALEREYMDAIIDDNEDKALEVRGKINAEIRREVEESVELKLTAKEQAKADREQATIFDTTVADMVAAYPVLDSETGSKEAIEEVVEWRDFYINKGDAPHIALEKAAKKIAPGYMDKPEPVIDTRKAEAMKRNAATAKSQPPRPEGVGNRTHGTISDPEDQTEWEKMPDKDRKSLLN